MKKASIIALVVIVLVLLVAVVYTRRSGTTQVATTDQAHSSATMTDSNTDGVVPVATDTATPPAATVPSKPVKLAYEEAVKRYGAQRIQFNAQCQATPSSSTFKSGLEIMLDNRANVERSIVFSGKTYKIPAYDYTVVTLGAKGIIYIDCGTSQNVAKLTVQ